MNPDFFKLLNQNRSVVGFSWFYTTVSRNFIISEPISIAVFTSTTGWNTTGWKYNFCNRTGWQKKKLNTNAEICSNTQKGCGVAKVNLFQARLFSESLSDNDFNVYWTRLVGVQIIKVPWVASWPETKCCQYQTLFSQAATIFDTKSFVQPRNSFHIL